MPWAAASLPERFRASAQSAAAAVTDAAGAAQSVAAAAAGVLKAADAAASASMGVAAAAWSAFLVRPCLLQPSVGTTPAGAPRRTRGDSPGSHPILMLEGRREKRPMQPKREPQSKIGRQSKEAPYFGAVKSCPVHRTRGPKIKIKEPPDDIVAWSAKLKLHVSHPNGATYK